MPVRAAKLEHNLARLQLPDLRVLRLRVDRRSACRGPIFVTTVTADKRNATILTPQMITPRRVSPERGGRRLSGQGPSCHPDILRRAGGASRRGVRAASPASRGEIQQMNAAFPVIELATLLAGASRPWRGSDREVTIFDSVGFALEDFSSPALPCCASIMRSAARSGRSICCRICRIPRTCSRCAVARAAASLRLAPG